MEEQEEKPLSGMAIVGYNLLGLIAYTIILSAIGGLAIIFYGLIFLCHFITCILFALGNKQYLFWLFSALIIVIVGFSTCSKVGNILG